MKMQIRAAGAVLALAATGAALAQAQTQPQGDGVHPYSGAYAIVAAGRSQYERDCFLGSCAKTHGNAFKVGGGYRFGVTSVEVWVRDLGHVRYANNLNVQAGDLHLRSLGVGAAWAARLGQNFEFTSRVGVAQARVEGSGRPSRSHSEPYAGLSLGWRASPAITLELAVDADFGHIARGSAPATFLFSEDGGSLRVVTPSLGARLRF